LQSSTFTNQSYEIISIRLLEAPISASSRRTAIIINKLITALIHLIVLNLGMGSIDLLFPLNGLGFQVLLYAYLNDIPNGSKSMVRWAFIAYTVITILAWVVMNGDLSSPLGLPTKVDEVILVALLWMDR